MTHPSSSNSAVADDDDAVFVQWLCDHHREGWVNDFRALRRTEVLAWADVDDLVAIFTKLGEHATSLDSLAALFAALRVADDE